MATKELLTRIALKYDTYQNWTDASKEGQGANLVLLKGELGICAIENKADATTAPTVLFKVGDGTTPFSGLKWASALAADVHEWAKAETVELVGDVIQFKTGNSIKHSIDLSKYATDASVKDITDALAARILAVEGSIGTGDIANAISALDGRLDVIEGEGAGSIKKAAADTLTSAQGYADNKKAEAITAAEGYTDAEVAKDRTRLTTLETAKGDHDARITANTNAISAEATTRATAVSDLETAYKAADSAINNKIGGTFNSTNTVAKAIEDAKAAGTTAQTQVTNLANGQVATNKKDIADNASAIATLRTDLTDETTAREAADTALDGRLEKLEAFFEAADHDGKTGGLNDALDTLVEIQKFITDEGTAADQMAKDIAANATAIGALQTRAGNIEADVEAAETNIGNAQVDIENLKAVVSDYSGTGAIKQDITLAKNKATAAQTAADNAKIAADNAQDDVDALTGVVNHATTGLAAAHKAASDNNALIVALTTRVGTAETDIDNLEATVNTGSNSNEKLRKAITDLQTLTGDANKGNNALATKLTTLAGVVEHSTTGLAATKAIADEALDTAKDNDARLSAIEGDYLKAADTYIFNCGSSSLVVHNK